MHVQFTFVEWLTLYSWPLWGTVESSSPWPVLGSHWRTCEVSTLYLENVCECTSQFTFFEWFWVILSDFEWFWVMIFEWFWVSTLHLENCAMHVEFTFFEWLTLHFWPLWGNGRNVNPSTTCHGDITSTFLWSFNSSSWKLYECTSNSRLFWVINPYFWSLWGKW